MQLFPENFQVKNWLPTKDLNPHKLIQSQVCCHYTSRQYGG